MSGGGKTSSTTIQNPTLEQKTLAKIQLGEAQDTQQFNALTRQVLLGDGSQQSFQNKLPSFFPGETVAGFSPTQLEGQQFATDRARQLASSAPQFFDEKIQFGTEGIFDASNPLVNSAIESAIRPVTTNFLENVFPQIGSAAQQQGAFGGSRQGILEAQSTERLNQTVGDISSQMALAAFNRNMDTFDRTLALAPTLQGASFLGADVLNQQGALQQAQQQIEINADRQRFDFEQNAPANQLNRAASLQSLLRGGTGAIGVGGGSTTSGSGGGGISASGLLGGASSGAGIASLAAMNPIAGAGLGALMMIL